MERNLTINSEVLQVLDNKQLRFNFLPTGDLFSAWCGDIQINQVQSNELDGSMNNLYLRVHEANEIKWAPLLGVKSSSLFKAGKQSAEWQGEFEGIKYHVLLQLKERSWFWTVELLGNKQKVDVIYTQDIGLAAEGALQANEAYISQYVDHKILEDENGYKVCSRQNQEQPMGFPYIQQGAIGAIGVEGYSTDGFQFFGKSYKYTGIPEKLSQRELANTNFQYELALTALKTPIFELSSKKECTFYGHVEENLPHVVEQIEFFETIQKDFAEELDDSRVEIKQPQNKWTTFDLLNGEKLSTEELAELYPIRKHEERIEGELLSFFTEDHTHIVLPEKESIVDRPHGTILLSGNSLSIKDTGIATTSYMYGLFNSQVVLGNTSMNKLLTNQRNHLNFFKVSGQRIYVKFNGHYELLAMPSVFEMGFNYCKWIYKIGEERFTITNFVANHGDHSLQLECSTNSGKAYDYLVTNQVIMNDNEYKVPAIIEEKAGKFYFKASKESVIENGNPKLTYQLDFTTKDAVLLAPETLFDAATLIEPSLAIFEIKNSEKLVMKITGDLNGVFEEQPMLDFSTEVQEYRQFFKKILKGFRLSKAEDSEAIDRLNTITWWYTHNMLIHYLSPHGLEQYGGAAWGTRDVCQGPVEFFLATQNFDVVREILLEIFAHQMIEDGNWPQWFMFDDYSFVFSGESHGDVIVWPLMALSEYLEMTGDFSILSEKVPFMSRETAKQTQESYTIKNHLEREIDYIRTHFLFDTYLSAYGDGDWDDTLQPANQTLKKQMASSWTVALTFQALKKLGNALESENKEDSLELLALAGEIEKDYHKFILGTDTLPGFVYMEDPEKVRLMIHPTDKQSGINYRLLPMTRSIIGELLDEKQAEHHYELIKDNLLFNDGVRLMSKPAPYSGGVSVNFKRAEQAANFGREVGLLYVHAQIRFVEAMCKYGKPDDAWKALNQTIPINLAQRVVNSLPRQSNSYFSSSDGNFATRYEAQENFEQLRDGTVATKGGWRIYSSGPGIFMNQLLTNMLGIRKTVDGLLIDPVISNELQGVAIDFVIDGKPVQLTLKAGTGNRQFVIDGETIIAEDIKNKYRQGGFFITNEQLEQYVKENAKISVTI